MTRCEVISFSLQEDLNKNVFPNASAKVVDAILRLLPDLPRCRLDYETTDGTIDSILPSQLCAKDSEELEDVEQTIVDKIPELCGSNLTLVFYNIGDSDPNLS